MTQQRVNCPGAEDHSTAQCPLVSAQKNELRQIITDALVSMVSGVTGLVPPSGPGQIPDFIQAPIDRAVEKISASLPVGVPVPGLAEAPSRVEAVIVAIRDLWDEDECPSYPVVAEVLRGWLSAPTAPTVKAEQVQCSTCNDTALIGDLPIECPDCGHDEAPSLPAAGSAGEERLFRKKPVTIEAVQWRGDNLFEVIAFTDGDTDINGNFAEMMWEQYCDLVAQDGFKIKTLEGTMTASVGDWIIKGIKGEFYPCKPDIFLATYEPVSNQEAISSRRPEHHPDDAAVDRFAAAMKSKLAASREKGRHGWQTASAAHLSSLLYHHMYKADPLDVANLAMMLHQNGQAIELPHEARRPADQQSAPERAR